MDFLIPRPPSNGSKGVATVPSASNFTRGNSENFFFVLTTVKAFRVARDLVAPRGREERDESLHNATNMHPRARVTEDAVVAEVRVMRLRDDGV